MQSRKTVKFGKLGDIPVPADGDGKAEITVYDPETSLWMVRGEFNKVYGKPGELPLIQGQ